MLGWFVALVLLMVLSLSVLYSRQVLKDIAQLQSAKSDNVQWTLTQLEVEYLMLANALDHRAADGTADLGQIREKYDILFSRQATLRNSPLFRSLLAADTDFRDGLAVLQDFLMDALPLIDGPDDTLAASLERLSTGTWAARDTVRQLSIAGLSHFAVRADMQRTAIAGTLRQLAIATASMFVLLLALSLYLLLVNLQKTRRGVALEQANQRMNTILSTSLDGMVLADSHGFVIEFNRAAEEIFQYRSADAKGRLVSDLFVPQHLRDSHDASMARLRRGGERLIVGKGRVTLEAMRADGEVFPIELSVQSAFDGEAEILIAFVRDISQRVSDEKELVQARDRALAGEKAKADFLTVMSHEIRTPLNGLLGNLSLLAGSRLNEEQHQYVRNMDVSGRILLKHVDSVLDIARFEAGKVDIAEDPVHLSELLQNLVDGQSGNAGQRGNVLEWSWVGPPQHWVISDAQRIYQILLNLVGNAIKFTELGRITIEAERDANPMPDSPKRHIVEFRVSDTGLGIDGDQITSIFDDFHTSDTSFGRAAGGTGLGLGIAKRIVTAMGGEIGVESIPNEGSTFWVRLPVVATEAPAPADRPRKQRKVQAKLDILVVEDNEINLQVARSMLKREGHIVTCAHDGQSGVDQAAEKRFDLIFMDISMPVLDGLEATRRIRAGGGPSASTPIIALSANVLPQDKERFRDVGMDGFVGKPLTRDALRGALTTARSGAPPDDPETSDPAEDIDRDQMEDMRSNLGPEAFAKLLDRFIAEADQLMRDLPVDGDLPDATTLHEVIGRIHKVAGSASVFGAAKFRELLNETERAAERSDRENVSALMRRLPSCWTGTRNHLAP